MSTMRAVALLLAALCFLGLASAAYLHKPVDKTFLQCQKYIYRLFWHYPQCTLHPEQKEIASSYHLEKHIRDFKDHGAVTRFLDAWKTKCIPLRGEKWSLYRDKTYPAKLVIDVMYNAKDCTALYKFAAWAREHISTRLFVYALYISILLRNDGVILPATYDITPSDYFNRQVIVDAWQAALEGRIFDEKHPYVVYVNFSCSYTPKGDWLMADYTQDPRLLGYREVIRGRLPFWAKAADYHLANCTRRGDAFFYFVKIILRRYYLERLSNHLPDIEPIDYEEGACGVDPNRRQIEDMERRILDAIDKGYAIGCGGKKYNLRDPESTDIVGSMVEGNADSINLQYYGSVYRSLLGLEQRRVDSCYNYSLGHSILMEPDSVMRSPDYYKVLARVAKLMDHHMDSLGPYPLKELLLPGVKVESLSVDKIVTYTDLCQYELHNAIPVKSRSDASKLSVYARQRCTKRKPYSYRLGVTSNKPMQVTVRFFIGPSHDVYGKPLSLNQRRHYMTLVDTFNCKLQKGKNELVRKSTDFDHIDRQPGPYDETWGKTEHALDGKLHLYLDDYVLKVGYIDPVPKGRPCGLRLISYAIITPYNPKKNRFPTLYPFERPIIKVSQFNVPNSRFCEAIVYHQDTYKVSEP